MDSAKLTDKVSAIPSEERFELAMNLALEHGDNPTDEQVLEFTKLFFGPGTRHTDPRRRRRRQ
jgi:hypothetical protein